ncbi:putative fatty acyl-CoA reductase CG5065 isoform X2 [Rhodnius prolixus]
MDGQDFPTIEEFYRNKCVLITGATGFIGKVLVEKLLRSCPDIGTIYLLMRPKRGQQVSARLTDLLNTKIFDWLKKNSKHSLTKVVAIPGDITEPQLGLSPANRDTLIANVSVVFHSAATVKFDEPLNVSVNMNVCGTVKLIELCEAMPKLEAMVHVSTAYCNCDKREINESVYPSPVDAHKVMNVVKVLDEEMLDVITPQILATRPNTYTFTKTLAEQIVYEQSGKLPMAIFRPSIVTAALREPIPGWIDNLNGPTGMLAAASKGVVRTMLCYGKCTADLIPVDLAINCMIAVSWYTATHRPHNITVYNCTSGTQNPIKWEDFEFIAYRQMLKYPPKEVYWYPGGSFKNSRFLHNLDILLFQKLPAYIIDFGAWITGRKPMMVRIQSKIIRAMNIIEFFTTRDFIFTNENTMELINHLKPVDQIEFDFDVRKINWHTYIKSYVVGMRNYILKEDPSTLPEARANLKRMYILHRCTQLLFIFLTCWLLLFRIKFIRKATHQTLSFLFQSTSSLLRKTIAFED